MMKYFKLLLLLWISYGLAGCQKEDKSSHDVISLFPLEHYDQTLANWIKPNTDDYDKPILPQDAQKKHLAIFYNHYFGTSSPWNEEHVNKILTKTHPDDLKTNEEFVISLFNNKNKSENEIGYGENFRPYSSQWIESITANIPLTELSHLQYDPSARAIATDNLYARALPTNDPYFYHYKIAGQGYPFDNLQMSALWAGSPVYILGETYDKEWALVLTQDYIAWVKSAGLARVDNDFITHWMNAALKNFVAITHTKTSIVDSTGIYRFSAYVGAVFPGQETNEGYKILIPVGGKNKQAEIQEASVAKNSATSVPLSTTPHHFTQLMQTLLGRPYGWGNMYFYNDCSAEMKNIFVPFGVWLPRHSSEQIYAGKVVDLSEESTQNRIHYLLDNGHPFATLIYIGSHILMYIGNFENPYDKNHALMPMTYQNMWGLSPKPPLRRAVIGQSVLFPLLEQFPEDPSLASQASKKYFKISQLDQMPSEIMALQVIDLKSLMYPY